MIFGPREPCLRARFCRRPGEPDQSICNKSFRRPAPGSARLWAASIFGVRSTERRYGGGDPAAFTELVLANAEPETGAVEVPLATAFTSRVVVDPYAADPTDPAWKQRHQVRVTESEETVEKALQVSQAPMGADSSLAAGPDASPKKPAGTAPTELFASGCVDMVEDALIAASTEPEAKRDPPSNL